MKIFPTLAALCVAVLLGLSVDLPVKLPVGPAPALAQDRISPAQVPPASPVAPAEAAAAFLGLPYRADGVQDERGRWTFFARPDTPQPAPGLNCSGLVVSVARNFLGRALPLSAMLRDRNGDSGPGAPGGEDWDFGFDLVLNVSEGLERDVLTPEGRAPVPGDADGASLRGFPLDDPQGWRRLLGLLRPERPCLLSFSRVRKGRLLHHHVALLLADGQGHVWFEQATGRGGVRRRDLAAPGGLERFLEQQRRVPGADARVLIVEVTLPDADASANESGRPAPGR